VKYYLKKFLVKALSSILDESNNPSSSDLDVSEMKVASYFATNKRSFAYSMSLRGPPRGLRTSSGFGSSSALGTG